MSSKGESSEIAARCHEIQLNLGAIDVPEFGFLVEIGMAVRLALHIRGLPFIDFEILKMVSNHYLSIPTTSIKGIVEILGDIEFVKIRQEGRTIKGILPNVPYYEDLYHVIGDYSMSEGSFNESEQLCIEMVKRLAQSPENRDSLFQKLSPEKVLFDRAVDIGTKGNFIINRRARGKDILLSPHYFSENIDIFTDAVASSGSKSVSNILSLIKTVQGIPLSIVEETKEINGHHITDDELKLLLNLSQFGIVKPPSIETDHSGKNYFLFTPAPSSKHLPPTKREIYERAMAIVSSVRQGQFLPKAHRIRQPAAIIRALRDRKTISSTTEATQQYKNLVQCRVGYLEPLPHGYSQLHIIDTEENMEALGIALSLVSNEAVSGLEINPEACKMFEQSKEYVESTISATNLRKRGEIPLSEEKQYELDSIMYGAKL